MKTLCTTCPRYSFPLRRCLDGKIRPPTIKGGVEAVKIMGLGYICKHSSLREKIVKAIDKEAQR